MKVSSSMQRCVMAVAICGAGTAFTWLSRESSCLLVAIVATHTYAGGKAGVLAVAVCVLGFGIILLSSGSHFLIEPNVYFRLSAFLMAACATGFLIRDYQREDSVHRAEREARLIVESMPGLGWSTDATGKFIYLNPSVMEYTNKRSEDLDRIEGEEKFGWTQVVHPEDVDQAAKAWLHCLETGEPYEAELRLRRFDGVYRWFRAAGRPSRDQSGRVTGWYGVTLDIDDQKSVEASLRKIEQQLRLVVDTMPALVWCTTPTGDVSYLSERTLEYLGLSREGTKEPRSDVVHPDDIPELTRAWGRAIETGQSFTNHHRLRRADGVYRWHEARAEPLRDETGRVIQWYGVNVDIDDRKRAERAIRSTQAKFMRASQLASLAELSASIAHEINQPLAAVIANSHACQRWLSAEPPNLQRARITAERIIRDANSAAEVVARIRALFKQTVVPRVALDLNDVIAEASQLTIDEAMAKNVTVKKDLAENLPPTLADRVQMQQVLVNLIRNGIDAMESAVNCSRCLLIRSRQKANMVLIEILDDGSGVEDIERIFEPFFTTKDNGMGMGLAICRSIIESHSGRLWAAHNAPQGTILSFTLPVRPSDPT